jgi:hypothetical protein
LLGFVAGESRNRIWNSHRVCRARDRKLSLAMDEARVTDGGKNGGEGNFGAQHPGSHITLRHWDRLAGSKDDAFEGTTILAQGDFGFGSAVNIIKDHAGKALKRKPAQVTDIQSASSPSRAAAVVHYSFLGALSFPSQPVVLRREL